MALIGEIQSSIRGAWRLVRRDPGGMTDFNLSVTGFWRSFIAALIILPLYIPFSVLEAQRLETAVGSHVGRELVGFAAMWVVTPLVMLGLTMLLQRSNRFAALVIASNWISVPQYIILAATHVVAMVIPPGPAPFVLVAVFIWLKVIEYFVVRTVLEVKPVPAGAVVVITTLASFVINYAVAPPGP